MSSAISYGMEKENNQPTSNFKVKSETKKNVWHIVVLGLAKHSHVVSHYVYQ